MRKSQVKTIPFNTFTNIHTQDNSGMLETAENVIHDTTGYKRISQFALDGGSYTGAIEVLGNNHFMEGEGYGNSFLIAQGDTYYSRVGSNYLSASGSSYSGSSFVDSCLFGEKVILTQFNKAPVVGDLGVSITFSNLGGTPPYASTCCVVDDFVLLANTYESSVHYPTRIWNSAINDETGWTAGTNLCDYDDNPELGVIYKIIGGEYCTVLGSEGISVMQRVGGETGWQIDQKVWHKTRISGASVIEVEGIIYYAAGNMFYRFDGSQSKPLAQGKLRTLGDDWATLVSDQLFAAYDEYHKCIFWNVNSTGKVYIYKIETDEFTTLDIATIAGEGSYFAPITKYMGNNPSFTARASVGYTSGTTVKVLDQSDANSETPDLQTGFYELLPNQWATITRIDTVSTGTSSEDIDVLAYDDSKTLIDTVTVTELGGGRLRQTGRYFKFRVQSDFERFEALKVEYIPRGRR